MRRSGYTLIEVLLALGIAVLLLGALYVAVDVQLRSAQAGRDKIEQSNIARTLFARLDDDMGYVIGLPDTARFRMKQSGSSSSSGGGGSGGGSSTTGTSSTASSTSSTSSSTASPSTGTSTSGSSSSATQITSLSTTGTVSTYTNANGVQVIILPYGVIGDDTHLNLFISRVPREAINAQLQQQQSAVPATGDLRRVSYWLLDNGQGLAKQEVKLITSDDADTVDISALPPNTVDNYEVFMEEVKSIQFEYFDGSTWSSQWDSTEAGADGLTPIGAPVAIRITVDIASASNPNLPKKTFKHVIACQSANGTTPMPTTTTNSTTGGGTTSP